MEVMNVTTAKEKTHMSTFTIDADNNITAHAALPAGADESQSFSSAKELAKLTAEWPVSRLVDTWNSFAGVAPFDELKPVKKFTNRKAAVARIWQAVTRLSPTLRNRRNLSRQPRGSRKTPRPRLRGARGRRANRIASQQEGGGDRDDEARQGRDTG
jgi:hypothetical protein